jgi:hypothetical protein
MMGVKNTVFVVYRRSTKREEPWLLARIFSNMEAAEEYMELVNLGDSWETCVQVEVVWNEGLLSS